MRRLKTWNTWNAYRIFGKLFGNYKLIILTMCNLQRNFNPFTTKGKMDYTLGLIYSLYIVLYIILNPRSGTHKNRKFTLHKKKNIKKMSFFSFLKIFFKFQKQG